MGSWSRLIDIVTAGVRLCITTGFVSGVLPFAQGTLRSALDRTHARDLDTVFPDATHVSLKTVFPPYMRATAIDPRTRIPPVDPNDVRTLVRHQRLGCLRGSSRSVRA